MAIDIEAIYQSTLEHYRKARSNLIALNERYVKHDSMAISDVIPGFEADKLEFGSYAKENYAVLKLSNITMVKSSILWVTALWYFGVERRPVGKMA